MAQFRAFEPGIEVNGQTVYAIMDGFAMLRSIPASVLAEQGIGKVSSSGQFHFERSGWYPQEAWLLAFKTLFIKLGEGVLFQIGLRIPNNAQFPPWVTDVHSAIRSIDIAYHLNHRKRGKVMFDPASGVMLEGIGHYGYTAIDGKRTIVSVCNNPYPSEFDHGILTAMARKFKPHAKVERDDAQPTRREGADSCTYLIKW